MRAVTLSLFAACAMAPEAALAALECRLSVECATACAPMDLVPFTLSETEEGWFLALGGATTLFPRLEDAGGGALVSALHFSRSDGSLSTITLIPDGEIIIFRQVWSSGRIEARTYSGRCEGAGVN